MQSTYLTVEAAGEIYGIKVVKLRTVLQKCRVIDIPVGRIFFRGLLEQSDGRVPVVDLSALLGRGLTKLTKRTCIVVADIDIDSETQIRQIALLVDSVRKIARISASMVYPVPEINSVEPPFIRGTVRVDGESITLLNVDQILTDEEFALMARIEGIVENVLDARRPTKSTVI